MGFANTVGGAVVIGGEAVMIQHTLNPQPTQIDVSSAGHQRQILSWNADLIIEAVQGPGLNLPMFQLAGVEQLMEGMQIMILALANLIERTFKRLARQKLGQRLAQGLVTHRVISIPSKAISQPARSAAARCAESASRTGLVLLM